MSEKLKPKNALYVKKEISNYVNHYFDSIGEKHAKEITMPENYPIKIKKSIFRFPLNETRILKISRLRQHNSRNRKTNY